MIKIFSTIINYLNCIQNYSFTKSMLDHKIPFNY